MGLISHASKVMLKILQARLQQYVNYELPDATLCKHIMIHPLPRGELFSDQTMHSDKMDDPSLLPDPLRRVASKKTAEVPLGLTRAESK